MSSADLFGVKGTNDDIDVLKLANEGLRIKVENIRVQLNMENERMEAFNQNSKEEIKA